VQLAPRQVFWLDGGAKRRHPAKKPGEERRDEQYEGKGRDLCAALEEKVECA